MGAGGGGGGGELPHGIGGWVGENGMSHYSRCIDIIFIARSVVPYGTVVCNEFLSDLKVHIWSVLCCNHPYALSPFLIGRMFLREPSWKYSAKLVGS